MIYVLLTSESAWQRNDEITFLTCLCISRNQDLFFWKSLEGARASLHCLDYGKV